MPVEIPYGKQSIDDSDVAAVVEILKSDYLTTGPAVESFETALELLIGVPAAAVSSGTAALHCAYAALGLGPGDEVITTPLTFVATAAAAVHLGATVRFADVDSETLTISPEAVERLITERTRLLVPVDFAGHPSNIAQLLEIARGHGLHVVTDGCHSFGAKIGESPVGVLGDATVFSFHPLKTVTTAEGGAVVSNQPEILRDVKRFRNHGLVSDPKEMVRRDEGPWHREVLKIGLNYRLSDLHAALGLSQLRRIEWFLARRRMIAQRYSAELSGIDGLLLPAETSGVTSSWHLYPVRIRSRPRRQVFEQLHAQGIQCQVHYLPVYLHPFFARLGHQAESCPVAEEAYSELLSLPIYPELSSSAQDRVIEVLREAMSG